VTDRRVILFDGWCPLCIRTVRFVLRADRHAVFRFAALDSPVALDLLGRLDETRGCSSDDIEAVRGGSSVALLWGGQVHVRSDAVLRIAAALPWPWRLLAVLRLVSSDSCLGRYATRYTKPYPMAGMKPGGDSNAATFRRPTRKTGSWTSPRNEPIAP